jgi:hypothetical protein
MASRVRHTAQLLSLGLVIALLTSCGSSNSDERGVTTNRQTDPSLTTAELAKQSIAEFEALCIDTQPAGPNAWPHIADAAMRLERIIDEVEAIYPQLLGVTLVGEPSSEETRLQELELRARSDVLRRARHAGVFDSLAAAAACPMASRSVEPKNNLLFSDLPPNDLRLSRLAKLTVLHLADAIERDEPDEVIAAARNALALTHHLSYMPSILELMTALPARSLALREIRQAVMRDELTAPTCVELIEVVEQYPIAPMSVVLEKEKMRLEQMIDLCFVEDQDEALIPLSDLLEQIKRGRAFGHALLDRDDHADPVRSITVADLATAAEMHARLDQLHMRWRDTADDPFWRRPDLIEQLQRTIDEGEPRYILLDPYPSAAKVVEQRDIAAIDDLGTIAMLALEIHHDRHGDYPSGLEALVPNILTRVPIDPYSGDPLHYRRLNGDTADGGYSLYSVGADGEDNYGVPAPSIPEFALMARYAEGGTDYVINRRE